MKKFTLILLAFICFTTTAFAQDKSLVTKGYKIALVEEGDEDKPIEWVDFDCLAYLANESIKIIGEEVFTFKLTDALSKTENTWKFSAETTFKGETIKALIQINLLSGARIDYYICLLGAENLAIIIRTKAL